MLNAKEKWNSKYSRRSSFSKVPDEFLVDHVSALKQGSVLDFACGTGRNSIWLAKEGFDVVAVDISDIGLEQLKRSAQENRVEIQTIEIDLADTEELENLKTYDNIIVNMYKPSNKVLLRLPRFLNDDGVLIICTHNWKQVEKGKFKKQFSLAPNELVSMKWEMKLLKYDSFELNSGFYDGYVFSK